MLAPESMSQLANGLTSSPLWVLVVVDDPLVLSNTAEMLEDLGHSVMTVCSAHDALAELKTRRFDVLLTDHAMPRMTGAQLIREVGGACQEMAVIIATGFAELPEDVNTIARLRKPYTQDDLAQALARSRRQVAPERAG